MAAILLKYRTPLYKHGAHGNCTGVLHLSITPVISTPPVTATRPVAAVCFCFSFPSHVSENLFFLLLYCALDVLSSSCRSLVVATNPPLQAPRIRGVNDALDQGRFANVNGLLTC